MKALIFLLFLGSCGVQIKNFEKHEKAPLLHVHNMPSKEEVKKALPSVVVVANVPSQKEALAVNAHKIIQSEIIETLQNEKFANVFQREKSKEIQDELTLVSFEGKQAEDLRSANYIVEIDVNSLSFSRKTKNSINPVALVLLGAVAILEEKSDSGYRGTAQLAPSVQNTKYEYTSNISGAIKIHKLPNISLVKTLPLEASITTSELASIDSTVSSAFFSATVAEKIASKEMDTTLFQDVVKLSVANVLPQIKKFLQKKAYILEKREYKKSTIFKINRGKSDGIKPLDKITIKEEFSEINPLTQEEEFAQKVVCRGTVAKNGLQESFAFVIFEKSCQNAIRLGQKAFVEY